MIAEHEILVKEVVQAFKDNPSITLSQFNNYLDNQKQWHEQIVIQFFLYRLAIGLAEYHGVSIVDYSANEVFTKVRDWIAVNPARRIAKVLFGDVDNI